MNFNVTDIIASVIAAVISSMGLGGGGVLILYLTLFRDTEQLTAQGLNLLFFIPCSITALIVYSKNKMIKYKELIYIVSGGIIGVFLGRFLLKQIDPFYLKIAFAAFLIAVGIFTVFSKKEKNADAQ